MNKKIIIPLLTLLLSGCSKENFEKKDLCESPLCQQYYNAWKNIFLHRNVMTESYFTNHIFPYRTEIQTWNSGESFNISYQVNIDWMLCNLHDQFIVRIDSSETTFPALTVTRGNYLSEEEINQVLFAFAFNSSMNVIAPIEQLKYASKRDALKEMRDRAGNSRLKFTGYRYLDNGPLFISNGHPYMNGYGTLNKNENRCIYGAIDLVTGDCEINEGVCVIID